MWYSDKQMHTVHLEWQQRGVFSYTGVYMTASVVTLATDPMVWIQFLTLPDFLSSGSRTGSTQPHEYN
jgi:hypothetical protein